MPQQPPDPKALALTSLRLAFGLTQDEIAQLRGLSKTEISKYERGDKTLSRETLDFLAEPLAPPEAVDVLLFAHSLIYPEAEVADPSPAVLTREEVAAIHRAAMAAACAAGRVAAEGTRVELTQTWGQEKIEAARQEAEALFQRLTPATSQERLDLVKVFPDYWTWAMAVRVCEASVKRAAHKAGEALKLAELALDVAERVPGEESWRSRLKGYCWAHIGNARRVSNDLAGADTAFAQAWHFWGAGADSGPGPLAGWRICDLEASLRRDQRRFPEALQRLEQARAGCANDPLAAGRILLKKGQVFDELGDAASALAVLVEVSPLIEPLGDARLLWSLFFTRTKSLVHLERYGEAAKLLPKVHELAVELGNELDLIRVVWLRSKVVAGLGRSDEAMAGLKQVGEDFTARNMPYDAALSWLDLSVLLLKAGRTAEVRELAVRMGKIFKGENYDREALAALKLFCDAALQEAATVELAQRVIAEIEEASRSAPPPSQGRGRG